MDSSSWVRGKCIGKGAFGTVSFGVSKSDGGIFAVKSVDLKTGFPAQIEALENEIRILRLVSSPYVVEFLGDDMTAPSYRNLHLEYLPGGTLADLASRNADVDEQLVRFYTWCLVNGLKHVHSSGFVHCDVKGRNVLLGRNGSVAKLADFGSAVEVAAVASGDGGAILPRGSPLWMAPEVIRRDSQGPESDVWSLGCTVIEMINGKPAWEDHGGDTLSRIGYSDELPEFPDRLSEIGKDFLEKCLRREPKERWSCDQLLQHPFLCSVTVPPSLTFNYKLEDSSPRCVLDWLNTDFTDDEDDKEEKEISSAKGRIGKLANELRANWETEGWFTVRGLETNTEVTETETEEEGGGANWEYGNCGGVKEGIMKVVGRKWEYSDKRGRANRGKWKMGGKWWLVWRCDDDHREECKLFSVIAGWSCHQYGSKNREIIRIYNNYSFFFYCKLFKFKPNVLLFPLFIFHIPFLSQFSSTPSKAIYMLFCSWPFMFS